MYKVAYSKEYLSHHGILGQKWGKRNGPPYPLGSGDHSASERKAGWQKSLRTSSESGSDSKTRNRRNINLSGKTGAKYDFSKDATLDTLNKSNAAQAYSLLKVSALVGLDQAARVAAQTIIENTASEAVSAIAGPAATLAVQAAIVAGEKAIDAHLTNKEKTKLNERRSNEEIDPNTGLHLKSKDDKSDDIMAVNPKYHEDKYSFGATSNCVRCTFAYDLRNRGYDVSAGLTLSGVNGLRETKRLYKDVIDVKGKGRPLSAYSKNGNTSLANDMLYKLQKEPDSRGQLLLKWPGGGGHSVAYEVRGGKVSIIDAQDGKKYSEKDSYDILCVCTGASYQRLDNLEFNAKAASRYVI